MRISPATTTTVIAGNQFSLTCDVEAKPRVNISRVRWLRNGEEIPASAISNNETTSTLDIKVGKIFEKCKQYAINVVKLKILTKCTNFHFRLPF